MRGYPRFLRASPRLLAYGFVLAFFLSFGQTFFIGLFNADAREALGLWYGGFGSIYSVVMMARVLRRDYAALHPALRCPAIRFATPAS